MHYYLVQIGHKFYHCHADFSWDVDIALGVDPSTIYNVECLA